jgi:hypothetical protein
LLYYLCELGGFVIVVPGDLQNGVAGLERPAVHDLLDGGPVKGGRSLRGICATPNKNECGEKAQLLGWGVGGLRLRSHLDDIPGAAGAGGGRAGGHRGTSPEEHAGSFSCGADCGCGSATRLPTIAHTHSCIFDTNYEANSLMLFKFLCEK